MERVSGIAALYPSRFPFLRISFDAGGVVPSRPLRLTALLNTRTPPPTARPSFARHRIFGGPSSGELASPAALASALREYKKHNGRLSAELRQAREQAAAAERRCLEVLAQHHRAHAAEREREAQRHVEEVSRLRDLQAAQLRELRGRAAAERTVRPSPFLPAHYATIPMLVPMQPARAGLHF